VRGTAIAGLEVQFLEFYRMEEDMNRRQITTILPALALGLSVSAFAADDGKSGNAPTTDPSMTSDQGSDTKSSGKKDEMRKAKKHPPTNRMDSAAPTEKSDADSGKTTKHPPTDRMDKAAPTQKSPGAASGATSDDPKTKN
jgi:hypothetical protein